MSTFEYILSQITARFVGLFLIILGAIGCSSQALHFEPGEEGNFSMKKLSIYSQVDSLMRVVETYPSVTQKLDTLLYLTDYIANYDDQAALRYARKANDLATKKKHKEGRAISHYYLAMLKGRQQTVGEGIDFPMIDAKISYRLFGEIDDQEWMIRSNNLIGNFFFRKGQYDSAELHFQKSLQLLYHAGLNDQDSLARHGGISHELANVYAKRMRETNIPDSVKSIFTRRAKQYYDEARVLYQLADYHQALLRLKRDLGIFHLNLREYSEAEKYFTESLNGTLALSDNNNLAKLYQHLGFLRIRQYQNDRVDSIFQSSLDFYHKSLQIQNENYYESFLRIGNLYHLKNARSEPVNNRRPYIDSALIYYKKAFEEAQKEGAFQRMQNITRNVASLCDEKEGFDGPSCEDLLGEPTYAFLNGNYKTITDSMDYQIRASELKFRKFEQEMLENSAARQRQIQWWVSLTVLIIAVLIFLLIYQRQQRKRLESRMEALRAQINPHFISNSLNAIENLVNQNQREAASKYLIHFSRFSRRVLTGSRNANTTLKDELETLKHFMALEQLRFRDKLTYDIQVDEGLNTLMIEVPAMIMQPYVENAIWHGIKPKASEGFLLIRIESGAKQLVCTIEDDGIGREKSRQMQAQSVLNRKSMGMQISRERLQVMGQVKGAHVEIIDLYDSDGAARGTRVVLRLPLKYKKEK